MPARPGSSPRSTAALPGSAPAICWLRCCPTKDCRAPPAKARRSWPRSRPRRCAGNSVRSARDSAEQAADTPAEEAPAGAAAGRPPPALDQFTINLTERARKGDIDPVIGRDSEIRQVIDILTRRRQNNPILTGEAGVGKTAVVEGLRPGDRRGDVPPPLKNVALRTLDLGLLQAGAGVKGEFENRLKSVIEEVQGLAAADHPVHRRGAHDDRRRRPGRARATPPTCSSRPWRAASCAPSRPPPGRSTRNISRATPPSTAAFRSSRSRSRSEKAAIDMMRGSAADAGEASQGAHPRRSGGRGGPAVAALHPGAPAAGQGGQPARHRLRPGGDEPAARRRRRSRICRARIEYLSTDESGCSAREQTGRDHHGRISRDLVRGEGRRPRARLRNSKARWQRRARVGGRDRASCASSLATRHARRKPKTPRERDALAADELARARQRA